MTVARLLNNSLLSVDQRSAATAKGQADWPVSEKAILLSAKAEAI